MPRFTPTKLQKALDQLEASALRYRRQRRRSRTLTCLGCSTSPSTHPTLTMTPIITSGTVCIQSG
jgi:hypothetical protein